MDVRPKSRLFVQGLPIEMTLLVAPIQSFSSMLKRGIIFRIAGRKNDGQTQRWIPNSLEVLSDDS